MCKATIREPLEYMEGIFDLLNKEVFESALSKVVITIQSDSKNKCNGWFTCGKVWKSEDESYHEINITAEGLNRSPYEIASTILHEMCHLYASQNNIKDTSRGGTYHNTKYRDIALSHGLNCECTPKYGWTVTSLKDEIASSISIKNIEISRMPEIKLGKKKKTSTRKYVCSECGLTVRATKELKLICGSCFDFDCPEETAIYLKLEESEDDEESC